jgi:glycosyltransferase involved in cell wall biosynthesis
MSAVSIVVIGRNEGMRLRACLESLAGHQVVYVDSGSTDGSVQLARSLGAEVVELDTSRPFSAARARNEGFARLCGLLPGGESGFQCVQFVDGDCAVAPSWLEAARTFLETHQDYAVVCGRRRERFPNASIYNRLCDMEWNTPVGEAKACGGDALLRVAALEQVGGYDPNVIAGEEPELCMRLRQRGWKIRRLDQEMTLHDAAMTRFGQWWKRAVRSGYGWALVSSMAGNSNRSPGWQMVRSNWFWGLLVPVLALALAWPTRGISLTLLLGYLALAWRVAGHMRRRGFPIADARLYAWFCVLSKFAGVQGQCRYRVGRLFSRPSAIIEYKGPQAAAPL